MVFSLKKILRKFGLRNDYIRLEIDYYTRPAYSLSSLLYAKCVIEELKKEFPQLEVLYSKKGRVNCIMSYADSPGYIIKISPNVQLKDLKEKCMELERDSLEKRISDIDIFYKDNKISRKNK